MTDRTRRDILCRATIGGVAAATTPGLVETGAAVQAEPVGGAPMDQYDGAHTGYAPNEPGPKSDPVVLWEHETDGKVSASPAVVDGVAYVAGSGGTISALDATDGSVRWTFDVDAEVTTSPTVVDGLVYVAAEDGRLYALDTDGGRTEWTATVGADPSTPVVADDLVHVSGGGALRLIGGDGDELDSVPLSGETVATPAVDDGAYVGTDDGTLYAFDVESTADGPALVERWSIDTVVSRVPTLSVADGTVWVTGASPGEMDQGRVYALDAKTGSERWSVSVTPWIRGSVAVTDETAYVGTEDGEVVALAAGDGAERWRVDVNSSWSFLFWGPGVSGGAVVAGETLYVGSEDDSLYAIDVEAGEVRWRFETGGAIVSTPTVVDGIAYVGSTDGRVYAITSADSSPVPLPGDVESAATGTGGTGGGVLAAVWSTVSSPLVLLGGLGLLLVLLAAGSADADSTQTETTGAAGDDTARASGDESATLETEGVPESLRNRRSTLRNRIDAFADRNELHDRTTSAITVPEPESFDDVDAARAAYDRLDDEISDWKDDWRAVMDRRSRLETRIDKLGSEAPSADAPAVDCLDLDEFRDLDDAREALDRLETRVAEWEAAFDEYRELRNADPDYEYLSVPEEPSAAEPASYRRAERARSAYESVRDQSVAHERIDDALARLDESTAPVDVAHVAERVSDALGDEDSSEVADRVELASSLVDRAAALTARRELDDTDEFLEDLVATIERSGLPETDDLSEYERIVDGVETVVDFLDRVDHGHPSIDADEWLDAANLALAETYPKVLDPVTNRIDRMDESLWTHDHLQAYSWEEFEELVGSLYRTLGYETAVTQQTADLGIDVWAEDDDERVAVQAKRYKRGNTVGRETLQKLASTLAKGDADRVVVVTTSTFARTAEEYAADFGPEIELVDGDRLLTLLNESELPPPTENG